MWQIDAPGDDDLTPDVMGATPDASNLATIPG